MVVKYKSGQLSGPGCTVAMIYESMCDLLTTMKTTMRELRINLSHCVVSCIAD